MTTTNASGALPAWAQELAAYRHKIVEPEKPFATIRPGDNIFVASACAEPQHLMRRLLAYAPKLNDVQIIHLLGEGKVSFNDPALTDHVRLNALFIGDSSRAAVAEGRADYTPVFLSEIPGLFRRDEVPVDIALIQVSPPDAEGYCSLGVSVETTPAAVDAARLVVAQVNPRMPRTGPHSLVHLDQLQALVLHEEDLLTWQAPPPNEISRRIAYHVARLIDDGATLQIGIGKVPQAVLAVLGDRRDLGVHTEMFTDSLLDLLEKGAVTNRCKGAYEGVTVATFVMGTQRLYDFIDGNPAVQLHPVDIVGDPGVIAANAKMTAINSALEVDLTGQICADSLGHTFYSGFGSQVDFIRGAARSEGGKPIIALPSTAKNDTVSRIVPRLTPGAGVVLTRGDVHYVVTEYGVAYLHGKSIRQRALALIEIAHPKFRAHLLAQAKQMHYVYEDQQLPCDSEYAYPETWELTAKLKNGQVLTLRPIRPRDEPLLQRLFYSLSDEDVYFRFLGHDRRFGHKRVQPLTVIDYRDRMAIVATVGGQERESIVGIARYERVVDGDLAECAFTVHPHYRRMGVGSALFYELIHIAKNRDIAGFRAEVDEKNRAMLNLFLHSLQDAKIKNDMHIEYDDGMYSLWYYFDDKEN